MFARWASAHHRPQRKLSQHLRLWDAAECCLLLARDRMGARQGDEIAKRIRGDRRPSAGLPTRRIAAGNRDARSAGRSDTHRIHPRATRVLPRARRVDQMGGAPLADARFRPRSALAQRQGAFWLHFTQVVMAASKQMIERLRWQFRASAPRLHENSSESLVAQDRSASSCRPTGALPSAL